MKNVFYLLAIMFLDENGKAGNQNVYIHIIGNNFILSEVVSRICRDFGFQKVTVLYRTEVTEQEFEVNRVASKELCCFVYPK